MATEVQRGTKGIMVGMLIILIGLTESSWAFTQEIQSYTQAIGRRSFAIMDGISDMLDSEGLLMRFGYPVFCVLAFLSALNQLCIVLAGLVPSIAEIIEFGGPLAMLAGIPIAKAREGDNRDQRLIDYVDDQVQLSLAAGQSEYENELRKKKK